MPSITCPSCGSVHDLGRDGDRLFMAMEYVEGASLRALIARGQPSVARVQRIGRRLAEALAAVHAAGVVHRDLKPDNVLVDAADRARLLDFGVARSLDGITDLTQAGALIGTPHYMAPEQVRAGDDPIDARADVFAFGVLTYELLTGRRPFEGDNLYQLIDAICGAEPPAVEALRPDTPAPLARLVARAMSKAPADRPADAAALVAAFEAMEAGAPAPAEPRRRAPWAMAAVVCALLLAGAWSLRQDDGGDPAAGRDAAIAERFATVERRNADEPDLAARVARWEALARGARGSAHEARIAERLARARAAVADRVIGVARETADAALARLDFDAALAAWRAVAADGLDEARRRTVSRALEAIAHRRTSPPVPEDVPRDWTAGTPFDGGPPRNWLTKIRRPGFRAEAVDGELRLTAGVLGCAMLHGEPEGRLFRDAYIGFDIKLANGDASFGPLSYERTDGRWQQRGASPIVYLRPATQPLEVGRWYRAHVLCRRGAVRMWVDGTPLEAAHRLAAPDWAFVLGTRARTPIAVRRVVARCGARGEAPRDPRGTLGAGWNAGWEVTRVEPGMAADIAGLRPGDRITHIDGRPVGPAKPWAPAPDVQAWLTVTRTVARGQSLTLRLCCRAGRRASLARPIAPPPTPAGVPTKAFVNRRADGQGFVERLQVDDRPDKAVALSTAPGNTEPHIRAWGPWRHYRVRMEMRRVRGAIALYGKFRDRFTTFHLKQEDAAFADADHWVPLEFEVQPGAIWFRGANRYRTYALGTVARQAVAGGEFALMLRPGSSCELRRLELRVLVTEPKRD